MQRVSVGRHILFWEIGWLVSALIGREDGLVMGMLGGKCSAI